MAPFLLVTKSSPPSGGGAQKYHVDLERELELRPADLFGGKSPVEAWSAFASTFAAQVLFFVPL